MIIDETPSMENVVIRGISVEKNQAKVTVTGVPDRPGAAAAIFGALSSARVIVDMIVQNVSANGATDISFTLNKSDLPAALAALKQVPETSGAAGLTSREGIAKLSVVGIGMRSHSGVAAKLFDCLGRGGINIQMISTSEIKIAVIIDETAVNEAVNLTHSAFGLEQGPYTV
jgi:aspartate kinase